jgi:hypothetical protein
MNISRARQRILLPAIFLLMVVMAACAAPAAAPSNSAPAATTAPLPEAPATTEAPAVAATAVPVPTSAPAATEAPAATALPSSTETPQLPEAPADGAAALPTESAAGQPPTANEGQPAPVEKATQAPAIAPTATPPEPVEGPPPQDTAVPTPAIQQEPRVVELEWPPHMRLGDSDLVRVSLIPSEAGYTLTTEFQGNDVVTKSVQVKRPEGAAVSVIGSLQGVGFSIMPASEQRIALPKEEPATLRWSISPKQAGQQRLTLSLLFEWAQGGSTFASAQAFSRGMNVQVDSIMGMTTAQAGTLGVMGLALGAGLGGLALVMGRRRNPALPDEVILATKANANTAIEPHRDIVLQDDEQQLLRAVFRKYARVSVEREFRSGYSGARTLLCLPVRADGRSDAYTIAKMGERNSIEREFHNYERFVKDTLPPVTARIQEPPATLAPAGITSQAVLRYTFIGQPGQAPTSLREALLRNPDPALLHMLFDTFGPNWWLQKRPYTFKLSQEYDRALPSHLVVEPCAPVRNARRISGESSVSDTLRDVQIGDVITLRDFPLIEQRPDGVSYSLTGVALAGQPPLRIRINSPEQPRLSRQHWRIAGTRDTLLRSFVQGFDLFGLPDPLDVIASIEHRSITGTQAIIHGDLNLENVLAGPGAFVWLIDFASTREGHTLIDFARLETELITQIAAPAFADPRDFLTMLRQLDAGENTHDVGTLIDTSRSLAWRCLFNPLQRNEYWLALTMTALGSLKFTNLTAHQRHLLYLTAAHVATKYL